MFGLMVALPLAKSDTTFVVISTPGPDFEPTLPEPSAAETVRVWDPADSVDVLSEKVYPTLGHPALPG